MKKRILIIPDIHGRNFWKNSINKEFENSDYVLFGGDYLDPYPWEGITRKDAIRNFQEIIDYCLCSTRCTVPKGKITEFAYLYALVMLVKQQRQYSLRCALSADLLSYQ